MSNGDESDRRQKVLLEALARLELAGRAIVAKGGKRGAEREEIETALTDALNAAEEAPEAVLAALPLFDLARVIVESAVLKQRLSRSKSGKAIALVWSQEHAMWIKEARGLKNKYPSWSAHRIAHYLAPLVHRHWRTIYERILPELRD